MTPTLSTNRLPISVIIAMYNTEKYIGECLDSFLAQTFKEFELIVIDDCSSDNSNAVVRSYAEKFNGRLKLVRLKKNSGNNGIPNNTGLALSRGEYVLFMDSDDTVTPDALEKLYITAKIFDAEVVACEKFYNIPEEHWNDLTFRKNLKPYSYQTGGFVSEPTLISANLFERVRDCAQKRFILNIWSKLIKRDFLINNEISITNEMANDALLSCFLVYSVEKFVRVPYVINYYRVLGSSITHQKRAPLKQMQKYLRALTVGFRHLDNFLSKREFFQQNPEIKNVALNTYLREIWDLYIKKVYDEVPIAEREEALRKEFSLADNAALTSLLFNGLSNVSKSREADAQIIRKVSSYLTARIDIEFNTEKDYGDFQLFSVSDHKATVTKPLWLNKSGIGYMIQSYEGKIEFVAKATAEGKIRLDLKGLDIRNPKDKSKRIPYWIDYTKLTVNGKAIVNKLTPAWHDKPYRYNIDVIANEEVTVQVEWFPHRGDVLPAIPKPSEKPKQPVVDNFLPNLTARLEVQMVSDTGEGDFQILSVSDKRASVNKPSWLQKDGIGYVIQSYVGKMEFVAKATADGQVTLKLKGMDIHDPENKSKLVPYWIDYTKLTVNGETIIDKLTPAWHDKPYRYDIDVKADEEVKIDVEWFPHRNEVVVEKPKPVEKPVEFLPNLTARLDVQMVSDTGEGDFQILSVSDKRASVNKPSWLQKDGIGYVIQSYVGKMEFVAKATADGQVTLKLKGMDIHDPENKSKLVPYWIDYTKLTINGETIIDKLTPAWHDKPYRYDIDVKADEEVKIDVEWFPHRDEVVVEKPKPVEKPVEFLPNLTARLDVQMVSDTGEGDFQILSVSDKQASVNKPSWLQKDGIGYVIQSYVGKMEFVAKATVDGQVTLKLKGMDIHDPEDKSKLVPYWIDYTKLTINGETIIDKLTSAWHDKPYRYDIDVKADEEVKVEVEWFPHRDEVVVEKPKPVEKPVEFLPNLTARLDVQMVSDTGEGDFQILSVSDKRASVNKPGWLQKDGIGYVIQSYVGKMEFVAKATVDGQVTLKLKGMDIHDPENKSKLVPYWIDYTKLTINGETIINKLTPAWHDKPYRYDINVKADEEVKIDVEWFPHRDEVVVEVIKPVEKPVAVEFPPNLTARLDLQMVSDTVDGDFKILSISDDKAKTTKPDYLNRDGIGYVIQSFTGKMELIAKANEDGQVILKLKGMDIRDPKDKSKRVPYWIDYTKLTIDGNTIFDKLTSAWHDKPYRYDIYAEADEEIKIQVEWLAHNKDT